MHFRPLPYVLAALILATATAARAQEVSAAPTVAPATLPQVTIQAGEIDRIASPAVVTLNEMIAPGRYQLRPLDDQGQLVPAQVERVGNRSIVLWIEPALAAQAGRTYELVPVTDAPTDDAAFAFAEGDGYRDLRLGDRGVLRDVIQYDPADHANTSKPFTHVFAADGESFITKGPGGKFPHHRGIFFGFKAHEDGALLGDFWHCPDVSQQHQHYVTEEEFAGPIAARSVAVTHWIDKEGRAVVRDTRRVTAWRVVEETIVLDCDLTVESLTGNVIRLGGDAHHAGFHFRAAQEVAEARDANGKEGAAAYLRPENAKDTGNDIWGDCPWVHCAFEVSGRRYQVTHLDVATNPRPTTYSTRPYGRFGAFFVADVKPEEPLRLRYRLMVRTGEESPEPAELTRQRQDFSYPIQAAEAR